MNRSGSSHLYVAMEYFGRQRIAKRHGLVNDVLDQKLRAEMRSLSLFLQWFQDGRCVALQAKAEGPISHENQKEAKFDAHIISIQYCVPARLSGISSALIQSADNDD